MVWVVDSADVRRMEDCRTELHNLLREEKARGDPALSVRPVRSVRSVRSVRRRRTPIPRRTPAQRAPSPERCAQPPQLAGASLLVFANKQVRSVHICPHLSAGPAAHRPKPACSVPWPRRVASLPPSSPLCCVPACSPQDIDGALPLDEIARVLDLGAIASGARHVQARSRRARPVACGEAVWWPRRRAALPPPRPRLRDPLLSQVVACSAVTGEGLLQGFDWMVGDISQRIYLFE